MLKLGNYAIDVGCPLNFRAILSSKLVSTRESARADQMLDEYMPFHKHNRGPEGTPKGLMPGEEIFVPYTHGSSYILTADDIDDRREHWYYVAKGRKITNSVPTPRVSSTPAPPRGGEGGNHHAGARVFQHVAGVSAPT